MFKDSIKIEDGFSETFTELTKQALMSSNAVIALGKSLFEIDKDKVQASFGFAMEYAKQQTKEKVQYMLKQKASEIAEQAKLRAKEGLIRGKELAKQGASELKAQAAIARKKLIAMIKEHSQQLQELKRFVAERAKILIKDKIGEKFDQLKDRFGSQALNVMKTAMRGGFGDDIKNRVKILKGNLEFDLKQQKIAYDEFRMLLPKRIDDLKRHYIERAKILKGNLEFDLKQQRIAYDDFKMLLPKRIDDLKRNSIKKAKLAQLEMRLEIMHIQDTTKQFIQNLQFTLKYLKSYYYDSAKMQIQAAGGFKSYLAERSRLIRDNLEFELKMRNISYGDLKTKLWLGTQEVKASLVERSKVIKADAIANTKKFANYVKSGQLKKDAIELQKTIKRITKEYADFANKTAKEIKIKLGIKDKPKQEGMFKKLGKDFAKSVGKIVGLTIISEMFINVSKKLAAETKQIGEALKNSIEKSLEEISLSDKLGAMYGKDVAEDVNDQLFELANQIGASAGSVQEMAAKAAIQGIGTDDFERIVKLSDKVAKLSVGGSTEDIANNLISSVKSGHDASTVSQMLGGGEMMERKLKRAGYERALNRGDVSKALEIAERITEEAGFTEEKYKNGSHTLSENYKAIMNTVDNVKKRLMELFNQELAPTVENIRKFIDSDIVKKAIKGAEIAIKLVGKTVNFFIEGIVDNIKIIGYLFAAGILIKSYLFIQNLIFTLKMGKKSITLFMKVAKFLKIDWIFQKLINKEKIKQLLLTKAIAAIKIAAGWAAVVGLIAAAFKIAHKFSGSTKSFTGWLKGSFAAIARYLLNVFHNVGVWFKRSWIKLKTAWLSIKKAFYSNIGAIKSKVKELLSWIITKLLDFVSNSPLSKLLDKLGISMSDVQKSVSSYLSDDDDDNNEYLNESLKIEKEMEELAKTIPEYMDLTEGVLEEFNSEGAILAKEMSDKFAKVGEFLKEANEARKKILGDTTKIRKMNEQEEELKWLKAFSDRQIMHAYSGDTTNNSSVINIGSLSEQSKKEMVRKYKTRPGRSAA